MNAILKGAAAAALVGALALASATPGEARSGRHWGAAGAGFVAGAIVGGAVANSAYYGSGGYYNSGYGYGSGYAPGYAYGPGYNTYAYESSPAYDAYAYETPPVYSAPRYYRYGGDRSGCATQGNYGQIDRSACNQ